MFETQIVSTCVLLNMFCFLFLGQALAQKAQLLEDKTQMHVSFYLTFRKKQGIWIY